MSTTASDPRAYVEDPALDLAAKTFWEQPFDEREKAFKRLRDERPISRHRAWESALMPPEDDDPGFWAITKYEDCRTVSRDVKRFVSGKGIVLEDFPEIVQIAAHSFLAMDGEEHRQLRGIVSTAFTPRNVRKLDQWIDDHAKEIVDEIIDKGEGDFCNLFAKEFPGRIFAHFFGVDKGSEEQYVLMDAAEKMLAWDDPEAAQGRDALSTHAEEADRIQTIALQVADKRRDNPQDDMVSWVLQADFEGRKIEDWELASFFSLLGSAANDTTRHTTAHAIRLLDAFPEQKAYLLEDLEGRVDDCVEEVLRYSSTIMHFRRTAIVDTELNGVPIKKGDKLVMWYCSGNFDEEQFPNAHEFDISRGSSRHLAFGAGGPHFCIGSALGRQMVKSALLEIYSRMPDIEVTGEPRFQVSNFAHGIDRLPVKWTPPAKS